MGDVNSESPGEISAGFIAERIFGQPASGNRIGSVTDVLCMFITCLVPLRDGRLIYAENRGTSPNSVKIYDPTHKVVTSLVDCTGTAACVELEDDKLLVVDSSGVWSYSPINHNETKTSLTHFNFTVFSKTMWIDPSRSFLYIAAHNTKLHTYNLETQVIKPVDYIDMLPVSGCNLDEDNIVLIHNTLSKVNIKTQKITRYNTGTQIEGKIDTIEFRQPFSAVYIAENVILVSDSGFNTVRLLDFNMNYGKVIINEENIMKLNTPISLAFSPENAGTLYIGDHHSVKRVTNMYSVIEHALAQMSKLAAEAI